MKILTVVFSLEKGGTERAAQNFAKAYGALGHDSRLVFTRINGQRSEELEKGRIPVYYLLGKGVLELIESWAPQLVHIHSHGLTDQEFNCIRSFCKKANIVETNVFSVPSQWEKDLLYSFQLSSWCESLYLKRGGDARKVRIIPYAVDTNAFSKVNICDAQVFRSNYQISKSDILLGRVGQNYDGKWSILLISIFEELCEEFLSLKLLVINPPNSILNRIQESNYKNKIIVIDSLIGDDQLSLAYSAMDIFVHIADQGESFGMTLAEALLCETPIVSYATPWADNSQGEVVGNRVGGYVAGSPNDFKLCLIQLINNKSLRLEFGQNGRRAVLTKFNNLSVAQSILNIISELPERVTGRRLIDIYDVQGKVNLLTKLFLWLEQCLYLTRYSSGYQSLKDFFKIRLYIFLARLNFLKE